MLTITFSSALERFRVSTMNGTDANETVTLPGGARLAAGHWHPVDPLLVGLLRSHSRRARTMRWRTSDGIELSLGPRLPVQVGLELDPEFQSYHFQCEVVTPHATRLSVMPGRHFAVGTHPARLYPLRWSRSLTRLAGFLGGRHRPEAIIARREELIAARIDGARALPAPLTHGPAWLVSLEPAGSRPDEPRIAGKLEMMYGLKRSDLTAYSGKRGPGSAPVIATFPPLPPPRKSRRVAGARTDVAVGGRIIRRAPEQERRLYKQGLPVRCQARTGYFELSGRRLERFIKEEIPRLRAAEIPIRVHPDLARLVPGRETKSSNVPRAAFALAPGDPEGNWFTGRVAITGLDPSEWATVLRAARAGKRMVRLGDGTWLALYDLGLERLLLALADAGLRVNARGFVDALGPGQLAAIEGDGVALIDGTEGPANDRDVDAARAASMLTALRERLTELREARASRAGAVRPARNFRARLRPYQKTGLAFFARLYEFGAGGILADDMGLGKTVQALAFLSRLYDDTVSRENSADVAPGPALIVGPLAALSVWKREAERFCPGLPVTLWHGPGRERLRPPKTGLVLTTFAVLARDIQRLERTAFACVIVDESQHIKNAGSRAARALRKIPARSIFCLSGTPLENHPGEFWSLMDLCFPGLLGTRRSFQKLIARPDGFERVQRRVGPFLLRRTKDAVLTELPERTDAELSIPLTKVQRAIYERERRAAWRKLNAPTDKDTSNAAARDAFQILPYLTRLRRIACHPHLGADEEQEHGQVDPLLSGKLAYLDERLGELRRTASGVLVFSQFTDVLALTARMLEARDVPYFLLKGDTPARTREKQVRDFQAGKAPFFLISLRAGGTALTLTRADTVFHLDPWWNPAAEDQATDRAYRMGQTRPVFVYRLYGENTVEAKVLALQKQKRALFRKLFADEGASKVRLSAAVMRELLG